MNRKQALRTPGGMFALGALLLSLLLTSVLPVQAASKTVDASKYFEDQEVNKYTGKKYTHPDRFQNYEISYGIDVSKYQKIIDWSKVKADGIDFTIIRIGNSLWADGTHKLDPYFERNYREAGKAGVARGVYYYSQAINEEEARSEAAYVLKIMRGRKLELPIVFDSEDPSTSRLYKAKLTKAQYTKVHHAFCEAIEKAGYKAMIYHGLSGFTKKVNTAELENKYQLWFARYNTNTYYDGKYDFWQYAAGGKVAGISGGVDMNFWYRRKNTAVPAPQAETSPVTGVSVSQNGSSALTVSFDAASGASKYEIWCGNSYDGPFVQVGTTDKTSYTHSGLKAGREYYYVVRAVFGDQKGAYSEVANACTPIDTVRTVVTTQTVNVRNHPGVENVGLGTLTSGTSCQLVALTQNADGVVWYHIRAEKDGSTIEGFVSSQAASVYVKKVTGLQVLDTDLKAITLRWNPQTNVDGYRVYGSVARNGTYKLMATLPATVTNYTIRRLAKSTEYYYRVSAFVRVQDAVEGEIKEQVDEGARSSMRSGFTTPTQLKLRTKKAGYLRKYGGDNYAKVKKIPKKTMMVADYRTRDKNGKWWYHVTVTVKNKEYKGYIIASNTKKVK